MLRAAALLTEQGYTRERAEELLATHAGLETPENINDWVANLVRHEEEADIVSRRQAVLSEHHRQGIPPNETPERPYIH